MDCDHGIILDTVVTSGEVNDAVPYLKQIEHIHREILPIQAATADSAYDLPLFHRVLKDHNIRFYVRPCSNSLKACGKGTPSSFAYDEENDLYRCPQGKELELRNLTRLSGGLRWVYYSKKADCDICPVRTECIGKCHTKHIERNYFGKRSGRILMNWKPYRTKGRCANGRSGARGHLPRRNGGTIWPGFSGEE